MDDIENENNQNSFSTRKSELEAVNMNITYMLLLKKN